MRMRQAFFPILAAALAASAAAAGPGGASRRELGVRVEAVTEEIGGNMDLASLNGALVVEVTPGTAGAGAGIQVNDVLLAIDGSPVADGESLAAAVAGADPTRWIPIDLWRAGQPLTVHVFLGPGLPPSPRPGREIRPVEAATAAPEASKVPKHELSGYIQAHYLHSSDSNGDGTTTPDRFRVLRARLSFKGLITRYVGYDLMIDPRSPELTGLLRDAFIVLKYIPGHDIRIGQQKTQFGYENPVSSTQLYTVNRSELADSLMRGINLRDIGIGLIGDVPLGGGFRFEDAVTLVNGNGLNPPGSDDNNNRKNVWGRLGVRYRTEEKGLTAWLGFSGANGDQLDEGDLEFDPSDDFTAEFERLGADFELDHKWFWLAAEYAKGWDHAEGETSETHGYYVLVAGKTPLRLGPLVRYDTLQDEFRRWTLGAYYGLPREQLRVLFNYERRDLEDGVKGDDRYYLQLQVRFKTPLGRG